MAQWYRRRRLWKALTEAGLVNEVQDGL